MDYHQLSYKDVEGEIRREMTFQENGEDYIIQNSVRFTHQMTLWRLRWAGHVERIGKYRVLLARPEVKMGRRY